MASTEQLLAIRAALLAQRGFTGCSEILDDPQGFAATHGEVAAPLTAAGATDVRELLHD